MDSLRWHTIRGHKLVLDQFKSKVFKRSTTEYMEFYNPLNNLDKKWFLNDKKKLNLEDRYELSIFDSKQFYKELIQCIEDSCNKVDFREIRIKRLTNDLYNRKKFEQLILREW